MKSKTEINLDKEFEKLGIRPRVYHFVENVYPYRAITVAMDSRELNTPLLWELVWIRVNSAIGYVAVYNYNRTTELIKRLKAEDIYGVAICDIKDQFNRRRGRIIAKGRLLKHLKKKNDNKM